MSIAESADLEEAYVALTEDVPRTEAPGEDEGRIARAWRRLLTRGGGSVE